MINKTLLGTAAALCGLVMMAATPASADLLDDITQAKKIRISTDLAIPPSGMMDSNMKPTGSDVEVAQLLAKDWGLELEFVQTTGATRIPNVLTGKADIIISTLSVTPERAKVIDFTKRYATLQSDVGCLKSSTVKDWPDLKDKSIGVSRGTTQDTTLSNMKDKDLKIARYDDDATMVTAAVSGQVDCVASSATIINQIGVKNPSRVFESRIPLATFDLAIGLKKGEQRLMDKLNAWIGENVKNGKLNAIYKKFHGVELPADMRS
ncbi:transporter substrate-binding domain-containing protein [Bradyrhizobium sp.]|jgi:polar amino acid transport system substrate-binding protein|uniref:transporter substrate-binding domain-containing protein n=1 Tax=Bradyrhizobium sp. TaxID=376 RepID=UPI002DDD7354|nr:transporter substrate-binding domain-containing protein [Bradyrhizobium sp.]HEV2157295.1 transporter substrate-binding domain-containing protein [Bradyrhizobium sp.]